MNRSRIAIVVAVALLPTAAIAGIHTWDVGEVFSNADGTIQFVEFVEADGGNSETGISGGSTSTVTAQPGFPSGKSFTWSGTAASQTANKRYLVGSLTFQNLTGAPPTNATMPLSVLPFYFVPAGDTVSFGPYDSCVFTGSPPTASARATASRTPTRPPTHRPISPARRRR